MYTEWCDIIKYVGTRDKCQCQSKWKQIQGTVKTTREWTEMEHQQFISLFHRMPYKWREIASVCIVV